MKQVYYLKTCSTCQRILKEWDLSDAVELREIKSKPITPSEIERMKKLAGSYESLFSKRAQLYKQRNLKEQNLSEEDIKSLILEHYTFLKRPVLIYENQLFIGNSAKTVSAAKEFLTTNER